MISPTTWVCCGLLAVLAVLGSYEAGTQVGDSAGAARVRAEWDRARLQQTEAARAAEVEQRNREQRLAANNLKDDDAHHADLLHLQADLALSRDAGDRLRARYAAAVAAADRATRQAATSTAISEAAGAATGVQADVPSRLIEAARLYADVAGQRGAAGTQCERRYDNAQQQIGSGAAQP